MEPLYKQYARVGVSPDGEPTSFELVCPDNFNFAYDVVDAIAAREPDSRALVWCSAEGGEAQFSFADMARLSTQAALALRAHGIGKGSRVMLLLKRHYAYWYTVVALHKLGAVAIPATHMLTAEEMAYRMDAAKVTAVVCLGEEALCRRVRTAAESRDCALFCVEDGPQDFLRLDTLLQTMPGTMERVPTLADDPMLLYFTSGTTGSPKAVLHSFVYPLYHIPTALQWQGVVPGGLHLSVADTGWGKASWGKIYGQWLCGSAVMVYSCQNMFVSDLLRVVKKYGVTTFCAPPTVYRSMVKNGFDAACLQDVRRCVTAGEDLKSTIAEAFYEKTGKRIYTGYGQTETALVTANLTAADCSLGKPMPLYQVVLLGDDGEPAEDNGEVVLLPRDRRFTGVCVGYLDAQGEMCSPFDERGYFHTGDIVRRNDEGRLVFQGRTDDMIKSSGFRISPQEIEEVLLRHPDVIDCAVVGVPDEDGRGTLIKAFLVLRAGVPEDNRTRTAIAAFAKENLAAYQRPRLFEFQKHLPKTISGKLRRVALAGQK